MIKSEMLEWKILPTTIKNNDERCKNNNDNKNNKCLAEHRSCLLNHYFINYSAHHSLVNL